MIRNYFHTPTSNVNSSIEDMPTTDFTTVKLLSISSVWWNSHAIVARHFHHSYQVTLLHKTKLPGTCWTMRIRTLTKQTLTKQCLQPEKQSFLLGLKYLLFSSGAPLNIKVWNNFTSYGVTISIITTERTTFAITLKVNLCKSITMQRSLFVDLQFTLWWGFTDYWSYVAI